MEKVCEKRDDGRQEIREDCNNNASYYSRKHNFPEPTLLCRLISECLGCAIGSFIGTVLVNIITKFL